MRAILIGLLIVVVVHSLMTLGSRVPPERLGTLGRSLARLGIVLGIFMPRLRMIAIYLAAMWPFLSAQAGRATPGASTHHSGMSEEEAREVLGVGPQASKKEIDTAWRALLKKHHPDQGGSAEYTRRLNEARRVLHASQRA